MNPSQDSLTKLHSWLESAESSHFLSVLNSRLLEQKILIGDYSIPITSNDEDEELRKEAINKAKLYAAAILVIESARNGTIDSDPFDYSTHPNYE